MVELPGVFKVSVELPPGNELGEWEEALDMTIFHNGNEAWVDEETLYNALLQSKVFTRALEQMSDEHNYQLTCYTLGGYDDEEDNEVVAKSDFTDGENLLDAVMGRFDLFRYGADRPDFDPFKAEPSDNPTDMNVLFCISGDE